MKLYNSEDSRNIYSGREIDWDIEDDSPENLNLQQKKKNIDDIPQHNKPALNKKKKKKGKKKKSRLKIFFLSFLTLLMLVAGTGLFLLYGPFPYFRDLWVTTAMSTLHHQWLATMFFDKATIAQILNSNKTVESGTVTDPNSVSVTGATPEDNATELPTSPSDGERIINGIGFTRLKTATYQGWVIRVFDPSRIYMAMSQGYGNSGEKVSHMASRLNAFVGINAGGFIDVNGRGNGGKADKILISKGKLIARCSTDEKHSVIGFDKQGRLLLNRYSNSQVSGLTSIFRDAVEFKPFLIVNGVPTTMVGNGGYGIQPRTAIGQTKDGVVIFVQIDGRRPPVIGASVKELQSIFEKYNAYDAANLDGGSSSVFVFKGKVVNKPSSGDGERFVPDAFLINYK
ncbi:MAG TPA: phosphodiester glycosidase family protein [Ruminiclostridium sp.]|nr:phosphodiester glycosidase family protein [Ruminiclostridium sp.]